MNLFLQALSARDRDGTGYITTDDLAAVLRSFGVPLGAHEIDAVLHDLNVMVDGFGKLDYRRFMDAMKQYMLPGARGRLDVHCWCFVRPC